MENKKNELNDELLDEIAGGSGTEQDRLEAHDWIHNNYVELYKRVHELPVPEGHTINHATQMLASIMTKIDLCKINYTLTEVKNIFRDEGIEVDDLA